MKRIKRLASILGILAPALFFTAPAQAADFPNKPLKIIVPYAAGGGTDAFARMLGDTMARYAGQPVVIDNRPGAAGMIAATAVINSAPDGYTLLIDQSSIATQPLLYRDAKIDTHRDLKPVVLGVTLDNVMLIPPKLEVKNVQELVELAKKNPGRLNYASTGIGTPQHLAMEEFKQKAGGLNIQHVPYKGGSPGIVATSTGEVDMFFISVSTALPFIESGRVKALASGGKTRSHLLPDLPTMAESGFPDFLATGWLALFAPKDTPDDIVGKLNEIANKALKDPELVKKARAQGFEVVGGPPSVLADQMRRDHEIYGDVIRKNNIVVE